MSGTISHSWNGTVLTITSDSGTSSADLKGEKGDTGIRGAQGPAGVLINEAGEIDLTGYATKQELEEAISNIDVIVEELNTIALDFTEWNNGSFTETLEDETVITHTVTFGENGNITNISGIEIRGL